MLQVKRDEGWIDAYPVGDKPHREAIRLATSEQRPVRLVTRAGVVTFETEGNHPRVKRPFEVRCPNCQALPGEPCMQPTPSGRRPVSWFHLSRTAASLS